MRRQPKHRSAGNALWTVIACLIVGFMLVVGVAALRKYSGEASEKTAAGRCRELQVVVETYVRTHAGVDVPQGDALWSRLAEEGLLEDAEIPKDPWGTVYLIERTGVGTYRVWSSGKDKQPDTEDDIFSDG